MKKGISPLVAAVLLIAATMSIAGILAYWASSFMKTQTAQFGNQTITGECQYADFQIMKNGCTYNSTNKTVALLLENNREVLLKDLVVYINFGNGSVVPVSLNDTLPKGAIRSFSLQGIDSFTKIIVKTQCPEISEEDDCK